jgi:hypothetical protein
MLLSCVGGIFWRCYKCFGPKQRPQQQQTCHYVCTNSVQICIIDQLNETNLSTNETDVRKI